VKDMLQPQKRDVLLIYQDLVVQRIFGINHFVEKKKNKRISIPVMRNNHSSLFFPFQPTCMAAIFTMSDILYRYLAFFPVMAQNGAPFVNDIVSRVETHDNQSVMSVKNILFYMENEPYQKGIAVRPSPDAKDHIKTIIEGWDEVFGLRNIQYVMAQPLPYGKFANEEVIERRLIRTSPDEKVFGLNVGGFLSVSSSDVITSNFTLGEEIKVDSGNFYVSLK
jgi:hypothetical protein